MSMPNRYLGLLLGLIMHKHKQFKSHATVLAPHYYCVCVMFVSFCMCPSELLLGVSPHFGCVCVRACVCVCIEGWTS